MSFETCADSHQLDLPQSNGLSSGCGLPIQAEVVLDWNQSLYSKLKALNSVSRIISTFQPFFNPIMTNVPRPNEFSNRRRNSDRTASIRARIQARVFNQP